MKKRRMKKLNNKGYSLVELIIVIAIIVVLTGAALITMNVMHSAKAKEAAITFDSEVAELINNSKNRAIDMNADGKVDNVDKGYNYGIKLYLNGKKVFLQQIVTKDGVEHTSTDYVDANNSNDGSGISLSAYVYIRYTDLAGNVTIIDENNANEIIIIFDKKGICTAGYGTYEFIRTSGGDQVASVTINKNGSHHSN